MSIYISRNKEKFGPYTLEDVQSLVTQGILSEMDYAWTEGATEWAPLGKVEGLDFSAEPEKVNLDEALKLARQHQDQAPGGVQPMANLGRDFKNLSRNVSATAGELRQFLGQMKGKSPKEMLGLVAQSTLFKGLQQSVILFAGLILLFTVIPFTVGLFAPEEEKQTATEASAPATAEDAPGPQDGTTSPSEDGTIQTPLGETATGNPVIDTLGIGETKEAPTKVNPLDDTGDDLFDELK
jgi:hypothetical protein